MNKKELLFDYINMADIQSKRLKIALDKLSPFLPLHTKKFNDLDDINLAFMDVITTRFSKLQDIIGSKIFPLILEMLGESKSIEPFIDKLNKLEKLNYLTSAAWWMDLREARNQITHDYPDNEELLLEHFNEFSHHAKEMLEYWQSLKEKLGSFKSQ